MIDIKELVGLISEINKKHTSNNWHTACILSAGDKGYALYDSQYTPEYGARSDNVRKSRYMSKMEAIELYVYCGDKSLDGAGWGSGCMTEAIRENKGFLLDHFTPEELEEHAKKLRGTDRLNKRRELEKAKELAREIMEEQQKKLDELDIQLNSL